MPEVLRMTRMMVFLLVICCGSASLLDCVSSLAAALRAIGDVEPATIEGAISSVSFLAEVLLLFSSFLKLGRAPSQAARERLIRDRR